MSEKPNKQDQLRRHAEAQLAHVPVNDRAAHTVEGLLHELQVHQVELEMQNEELRRSLVALEESRDRYVDLYEFAPVGYITLSHAAQITAINLTGAALLGEDRKRLLKRRFSHLIAPADQDCWQQYFMQAMQNDKPTVCELRLQRSDGMFFDAHLDGLHIMGGSTTPVLRITLTDITERKRLDRMLQDKSAELELARLAAEKANRAKSVFLSSMSHELRTPLNAILGFAQLMESSPQPQTDTQRTRLRKITEAGWYLLNLINEILDLSMIEVGQISLKQEPLSLADIMHECHAMIDPQAQQRGIRISFLPFDDSWLINADRTRIKQVLLNLFSNALKYNKKQGTVVVECTCTAGRIRISIKDSGTGLSAEHMAKLFQPFNRLGQESGGEEGTGIGLALSKRLVDLMGGTIGVESTVGAGSEFWIEMPRGVAPQPAVNEGLPARLAPQGAGNAAQHTLLCVEDDPASLLLIEQIVREIPRLRMLSAGTGNLGVALARAHIPDVILMDVNLPDISGIKALQALHKDAATAHIPVIAITANAICDDIEKGLDTGFFGYLTKPFRIDELMNTLDDALIFSEMRCANTKVTGEEHD